MNKKAISNLDEILSDKTSGSSELLMMLNIYFLKNFVHISNLSGTIKFLQKHFRSFQNIQNYLKQLQPKIHSKQLSEKFFTEFKMRNETLYDRIFANSLPYLKNKRSILTISNSKTVFEILRRLGTENCKLLTVSESRPKFEGRKLAKKLGKEKISVEVISEAMCARNMEKCDCVLIGADSILKNGNVVNKIGSLQLAILSKYFKKPFFVLTEKSKFSLKNEFDQIEESRDEIWKNAPKGVTIKNIYFETIPASLISKIITD